MSWGRSVRFSSILLKTQLGRKDKSKEGPVSLGTVRVSHVSVDWLDIPESKALKAIPIVLHKKKKGLFDDTSSLAVVTACADMKGLLLVMVRFHFLSKKE